MAITKTQTPTEQYGGAIERQIEMSKRALAGGADRPLTPQLQRRFAEIEKAAGVAKDNK